MVYISAATPERFVDDPAPAYFQAPHCSDIKELIFSPCSGALQSPKSTSLILITGERFSDLHPGIDIRSRQWCVAESEIDELDLGNRRQVMTSSKVQTSISRGAGWWVALNVSGSPVGADDRERYGSVVREVYIFKTSDPL